MTEHELDEMLDLWEPPPMRDSIRDELRAGFAAARAPRRARGLLPLRVRRLAVAAAAAAAVVFAIVQASPKIASMASADVRIPFCVEAEFVRYAADGSVEHRSHITSIPYGRHQVYTIRWNATDSPLDVVKWAASSIRTRFILAAPWLVLREAPRTAEPPWFARLVQSGCSEGKTVIGFESVAGHDTTVAESLAPGYRVRIWMAPDLQCFALKLTDEVQQPDGTYRLRHRNEAVKVRVQP